METSPQVPTSPESGEKTYAIAQRDLFDRGHAGDATALPEGRKASDEHPNLAGVLGDMPTVALESLLSAVSGESLTVREAVRREADRLCDQLAVPDALLSVKLFAA